jgi:hypothetical protein
MTSRYTDDALPFNFRWNDRVIKIVTFFTLQHDILFSLYPTSESCPVDDMISCTNNDVVFQIPSMIYIYIDIFSLTPDPESHAEPPTPASS